jgi:hypothetical protein
MAANSAQASKATRIITIPSRQLIPKEKLPSQQQLLDVLVSITENNNGRNPAPEALPNLPPFLPKYIQDSEFTDMASVNLQYDDMDPAKAFRQQNLQRLLQACQIRNYRALGLPPPALYRAFAVMSKYDPRHPEAVKGNMIVTTPAVDPFKVITVGMDNFELIEDKASNVGIPIIPALDHANNCDCQALYMNNNYESLQPVKMCIPRQIAKQYNENPKWPNCFEMGFSAPVYRNISDIFYSEVSVAGTVLPQVIRRQPVAQLTRSHPVIKLPQYAEMNIRESEQVAAAVIAQLDRGEIRQFTKYFNEGPIINTEYDISRFRRFTRQMENNIDITSYGTRIKSMEDILINEPLVDSFYGRQCCEYCLTQLNVQDETTYLNHLIEEHTNLLYGYFTCPACLIPTVHSSLDYTVHYAHCHANSAVLMNVLNETNVHVRMQHGHILNIFITMVNKMKLSPELHGPEKHVSSIGGFTLSDPSTLAAEVLQCQQTFIPPGFLPNKQAYPSYNSRASRSPSPEWTTVIKKKEKSLPTTDKSEKPRPTSDIDRQKYTSQPDNFKVQPSISTDVQGQAVPRLTNQDQPSSSNSLQGPLLSMYIPSTQPRRLHHI